MVWQCSLTPVLKVIRLWFIIVPFENVSLHIYYHRRKHFSYLPWWCHQLPKGIHPFQVLVYVCLLGIKIVNRLRRIAMKQPLFSLPKLPSFFFSLLDLSLTVLTLGSSSRLDPAILSRPCIRLLHLSRDS